MVHTESQRQLYERWVKAHASELFRFAYRLSGNRQVAEDLVQEVFVEAWRSLAKQREPERARSWLYQILRYRYSHYLRDNRHRLRTSTLAENLDPADGRDAASEALAQNEIVQRALDTLSPELRETFLMVFLQGAKCREVAEILHIPLGTVLSRLNRARAFLRAVVEEPVMRRVAPGARDLDRENVTPNRGPGCSA